MKKLTDDTVTLSFIKRNKSARKWLKKNKLKRIAKKRRPRNQRHKEEAALYYKAHLSAYMGINSEKLKVNTKKSIYIITLPRNFCLYENPEGVLRKVKEISSLSNYKNIKEIFIDHSECINHDLAAEMIFANAVKSLQAFKPNTFVIRGRLPRDEKMRRLLKSVGVVKDTAASKFHESDKEHLKLYRKRSDINEKSERNICEQDRKAAATEGFTNYLNECLNLVSSSLDYDDQCKLTRYLAEVLGNAEDHSGGNLWQIVGYLDSLYPDNLYCEIVIFNIGKSFYETFVDKEDNSIVNNKRLGYVGKHSSYMSDELLTLVYSMQQNASSKLDEQIDRGQGTKYFMELFHHLMDKNENTSSKPKMFILSGGAILKMDGTYSPKITNKKLVYAMNKENNLSIAPDKSYIKSLGEQSFPGAVIYIRYSLQETKELGEFYER